MNKIFNSKYSPILGIIVLLGIFFGPLGLMYLWGTISRTWDYAPVSKNGILRCSNNQPVLIYRGSAKCGKFNGLYGGWNYNELSPEEKAGLTQQ
jgi:hypothetical protein